MFNCDSFWSNSTSLHYRLLFSVHIFQSISLLSVLFCFNSTQKHMGHNIKIVQYWPAINPRYTCVRKQMAWYQYMCWKGHKQIYIHLQWNNCVIIQVQYAKIKTQFVAGTWKESWFGTQLHSCLSKLKVSELLRI